MLFLSRPLTLVGCGALLLLVSASGCREAATPAVTSGSGGTSIGGTGGTTGAGGSTDSTAASGNPGATCAGVDLGGTSSPRQPANAVGFLNIGATQTQAVAPPAISGGTLVALPGDQTAVAADPDRDQIYVVDLAGMQVSATIALKPGDEPGRAIVDSSGRVHVALRRGGAVVAIDPVAGTITSRRQVCAAPRGLAHDPATDLIHVACAGGELISLPASGGDATRTLQLDRDLRDIVVEGDKLWISRFRAAEILHVDANGAVMSRTTGGNFRHGNVRGGQPFSPAVGWRMIGAPGGGVAMMHQRGVDDEVQHGTNGSYGGLDVCHTIVHSAITCVKADGTVTTGPALENVPLAVDMAISPDGKRVAMVSPANGHLVNSRSAPSVQVGVFDGIAAKNDRGCVPMPQGGDARCLAGARDCVPAVTGEPTAIAFLSTGSAIVQSREPALLAVPGGTIALSSDSRNDTGHALFHANVGGASLACASCHAEGSDDGRVWNFACSGRRRTQSLQTGLRGTEPFHWDGDEKDFPQLVQDVFTKRMSGPALADDETDAILSWLDAQPRQAKATVPQDSAAVARGRVLFESTEKAGCAACHTGPQLTNNKTVDVGTGGAFQVPSLVGIANHAPYMHTGCANTLRDRFSAACGGGDKHGATSKLTANELSDLIGYLETL